ncbi:hypothetical protein INT48_009603 [Thamnidium elegans]|uniref:Uncharacterized protein n=1 Tax=Thamnidium elegans TaxID=101142 RepID=A0A8H7SLM0_9FUNG|nr:hypothetical protein INT48_009603 [Thamnidium elegans]
MLYKKILVSTFIISALLLSNVLAFSIRLFSPGSGSTAGSSVKVVFEGDSPKLVVFKIAVQNKDNTLTAIESVSAPNTTPGTFVRISIPDSVAPGINYWFVAVDSTNELNYATLGPLVIRKMFDSNNPTASITADSGTSYKTDGGQLPVSATKTTTNATPTDPVAFPTDMFPSDLFPSGIFPSGLFPSGVYPTGTSTGKDIPGKTDDHDTGISMGAIIGIAVGGFVFVAILLCVFYCCCIKKAVKTLTPVINTLTRPNNMKNESSIPMVSTPSTAVNTPNIHKSPVLPSVTLVSPQAQEVSITPVPQMTPTSPVSTSNTTEYTFSASNENVYNNQYPPAAHNQQSYPSYPYPYNPNTPPQGLPYPSQDFMPMPEYFNGGTHYGNQQNWDMQHSESTIVPMAESNTFVYPPVAAGVANNQATKTELAQIPTASTVFNQKVEYNHDLSDKAEYNQKPDTTEYNQKPDEAVMYNKPNSATVQQYNKPHERED